MKKIFITVLLLFVLSACERDELTSCMNQEECIQEFDLSTTHLDLINQVEEDTNVNLSDFELEFHNQDMDNERVFLFNFFTTKIDFQITEYTTYETIHETVTTSLESLIDEDIEVVVNIYIECFDGIVYTFEYDDEYSIWFHTTNDVMTEMEDKSNILEEIELLTSRQITYYFLFYENQSDEWYYDELATLIITGGLLRPIILLNGTGISQIGYPSDEAFSSLYYQLFPDAVIQDIFS
jgi:hypothetical protein